MTERIHVSRHAFLVAGIAAVLTFLGLFWIGRTGDRFRPREREVSTLERQVAVTTPKAPAATTPSTPVSLAQFDHWVPPPVEFVKVTAPIPVYNSRGKEVRQFSVGKRLRVSKRSGDTITINYLGEEIAIPTASTEPSE